MVIILISINVYVLIMGGIFSKRKYSYLGGIRGAIASVGYEVIFTLAIVLFILYSKACVLVPMFNVGLFLMYFRFFISVLIELGRTPFDYVESERELVSGFNTEYRRVSFVLLFLKEYGSLLFFSQLTRVIFFYGRVFITAVIYTLLIFIRRSLPRLRYDSIVRLI